MVAVIIQDVFYYFTKGYSDPHLGDWVAFFYANLVVIADGGHPIFFDVREVF